MNKKVSFSDEDWDIIRGFTAAALSGVCANPIYQDPQMGKTMAAMKISPEAVAVNSAIKTYEMLVRVRKEFEKPALTVTDGGKA